MDELKALLERAKNIKMTRKDIEIQRRSWVIGEMMLEHPNEPRETFENLYDKVTENESTER